MSLYQPRKPEIPGPVSIRQEGANPYDASGMPNLNISGYNYKDSTEVNENIHKGIKRVLESERHAKLADPMYGNDISTLLDEVQVREFIFGFENILICSENWFDIMTKPIHPDHFCNVLNLGWKDMYVPL